METPESMHGLETPQPEGGMDPQRGVEIDISSPSREELLEIMHGLMIDYNLMTKCLEETKQAAASAEEHASAVQQECIVLRQEKDVLHEELQDIKQQLNKKDSELEECNIKLRWAQEAPRPAEDKSGYVTLSAMNEQMQIAATQGLREKQQRENLEKEVKKLKQVLEETKLQNKELQGRLSQRTQQDLVDERQKQEIQDARSRFSAKKHRAREDKARGTDHLALQRARTGQSRATAASPTIAQENESTLGNGLHMTPRLDTGESGGHPLQPVASDTSMPANSASGCVSQVTPGSTAATRMLSPLSGGAISGPDFGPSPSERATAVLARASRHGHTSPAQIPPPSNSTSLAEQPSLMPMARLLENASLAHQASVEEVRHAPSSVMCSQVWPSLAPEHSNAVKKSAMSFGRSTRPSPSFEAAPEAHAAARRTSPLDQSQCQSQDKRPSSDRPARKSLRQPWPLEKKAADGKSADRHIFKQGEGYDDMDEVRRSVSCSPQLSHQRWISVEERCSVVMTAGSTCASPNTGGPSMAHESAQEASNPSAVTSTLPGTQQITTSPECKKEGLYSISQDMTVFSNACSMRASSQNENMASEAADAELHAAVRSSSEAQHDIIRPPLKESSDNCDPPPRPRKSRSRNNAAVVEAAFDSRVSDSRINTAGSLHSRTYSGKLSPKKLSPKRQDSVGRRAATARPVARDTKWTPRNTITPSPAKARSAAGSWGKGGSAQKKTEWKAPNRNKSGLTNARTLPLNELKRSADFKINASASSQ